MKFINESLIEQAAEILNGPEERYESIIEEMQEKQPVLLSYFFADDFQAFTQSEKEYLLYLMLVIWKAISLSGENITSVTEQQLNQAEELNWELLQGVKAKSFHERLNPFFENTTQEDLLAFVEDALSDEDAEDKDGYLATKEGREAMFVCLKSAIDCLVPEKE